MNLVGFTPLNIKQPSNPQPQRQKMNNGLQADTLCLSSKNKNINFGQKIDVNFSVKCCEDFAEMIENGVHEDSKDNRKLLKQVISGIKSRRGKNAKWDIKEIKEAIFENSNWNKDDELKEIFKDH